ncbi:MAG: hypothetical protein AAGB04_20555 [Pseudomonadota bacterium]
MGLVAVDAVPFEDFIDGYFPLGLSLRQLLDRHGFASAWIVMRVAPMMDIPGLLADDPVPLHVDPADAGQIDWLAAAVQKREESAVYSGCANWAWNDQARVGEHTLPARIRLAEPAFIRGIGFLTGAHKSKALGAVRLARGPSDISLDLSTGDDDIHAIPGDVICDLRADPPVTRLLALDFPIGAHPQGREIGTGRETLVIRRSNDPITARIIADFNQTAAT